MEVCASLSESEVDVKKGFAREKRFEEMSSTEIKDAMKANFAKVSEELIKYTITERHDTGKVLKALDKLVEEDPGYGKIAKACKETIEIIEWLQILKKG
ncbi:MAG: hypothetical protein QXR29_02410 [Candidatus Micrarchaeaceae archaeon]